MDDERKITSGVLKGNLLTILVVGLIAAVCGAGWYAYDQNKTKQANIDATIAAGRAIELKQDLAKYTDHCNQMLGDFPQTFGTDLFNCKCVLKKVIEYQTPLFELKIGSMESDAWKSIKSECRY